MPVSITWTEIVQRLAFTMIAGTLIGLNRWERGRAAGLRTTLLVSLAASIAMIQANLLMGTAGKAANSFVVLDLMRLPLGILSGMGFIGAGVILRRGQMVVGVTTAATLWFATVMGLCFGGGQTGIGLAAMTLGLIVLWCFRWIESGLQRERSGTLTLTFEAWRQVEQEIRSSFPSLGFRISSCSVQRNGSEHCTLRCEIRWRAKPRDTELPAFVGQFAARGDILRVQWKEAGPADV